MSQDSRRTFQFDSKYTLGKKFWKDDDQGIEFNNRAIKNEPCFFRASTAFATRFGGPITRAFIEKAGFEGGIVDTRSHMLMPGMWPCIPGWHHDDVPRDREDKQPNYRTPTYKAHHVMGLVSGELSPTEFLIGSVRLDEVRPGEGNVYEKWDDRINDAISGLARYPKNEHGGRLGVGSTVRAIPSGHCIFFNADDFHRGVKATGFGFRWFGRITINTEVTAENEFRQQTNVYLDKVNQGW